MDPIKNLLNEWGLPSLIDTFTENAIDEDIFNTLSENDIKELIPTLGIRKKFISMYNNYMVTKAVNDSTPVIIENTTSDDTISLASAATSHSTISIIDLDDLSPQRYSEKATVGLPVKIYSPGDPYNTVAKLLDTTEEGKLIKASYGPGKKFLRTNLCNLIIKNELKQSQNKTITTERFKQLAQEIYDIFMHENPEIYYLPYTKGNNNKVIAARGKLWSTYIHQRKIYRELGLIKKNNNVNEPSTSSLREETDDENLNENDDSLIWLQNNSEPFEQVSEHWVKTTKFRLKEQVCIADYFKKYPALSRRFGYLLLDIDFSFLYEEKKNDFFIKWPLICPTIYSLLKKKRDSFLKELLAKEEEKYKDTFDEFIQIVSIKYLPFLLQSPLIKCKKPWKPSKQEMIDGFILFLNDIGDVQKTLTTRNEKLKSLKLTAQPIPLIVGPYHSWKCFVSIDETLYDVENPLKAVDLCFKIYHSLNARYPPEAEPAWTFLQKGVYGINTSQDTKYTSVNSLIADIKVFN